LKKLNRRGAEGAEKIFNTKNKKKITKRTKKDYSGA
jgi:hypothetical protein